MEIPRALQLAGVRERAGVKDSQAGALGQRADLSLGVVVVGGDEDVERLAVDPALDERAGERGVEALTTFAPGPVWAISCATEPASTSSVA